MIDDYISRKERDVIGMLILFPKSYDVISCFFNKPCFFLNEQYSIVFGELLRMIDRGDIINLLNVSEQLRKNGVLEKIGGQPFLLDTVSDVVSCHELEFNAKIIIDNYRIRELRRLSDVIRTEASREIDPEDLIELIQKHLVNLHIAGVNSHHVSMFEGIRDAITRAEDRVRRKLNKVHVNVPTGLVKFDSKAGGLERASLTILAARPSMGKTALSLFMMKKSVELNHGNVLFFSIEMSAKSIFDRFLLSETTIDSDNFRSGNIFESDWKMIQESAGVLLEKNIFVNDQESTLSGICSFSRNFALKKKIDLLVIDYLQLISVASRKNETKNEQVGVITRTLKLLSKELDCAVLLLSQLNRQVELRSDKMPVLADLRDSGSIEQDADMVLFLLRPDYYHRNESGYSLTNEILINNAKNRNGSLFTMAYKHNECINDFFENFE
jgi:replicative DNA helicase